jgi:hypothetical protein
MSLTGKIRTPVVIIRAFSRMLKKAKIQTSSFDRLRIRLSVFNALILMVSLSRFGGLTVRPWAA